MRSYLLILRTLWVSLYCLIQVWFYRELYFDCCTVSHMI